MKSFHLKSSLIIALIASTIMLGAWEMYWRSKPDMYRVGIEDDRYFWSEHRARVEKAGQEDVIIIGSSRTGFNVMTHTWKEVQGVDPIKLARYNTPDARTGNNWSLYKFGYLDEQRNIIMLDKMTEEPEFAKKIQDVWGSFLPVIAIFKE